MRACLRREEHASTVTTITKSPISSEGLPLHTECDATFEGACSARTILVRASAASASTRTSINAWHLSSKRRAQSPRWRTLSPPAIGWDARRPISDRMPSSSFTAVLLAQAQRCVYEEALERGLSASSMEAIAAEASVLYADAHKAVKTAIGDKDASLRSARGRMVQGARMPIPPV